MALLVLGYPTITEADRAWIQQVRERHDELYYRVVDPHFTLVFPVFGVDRAAFTVHVAERVRGRRPFRFVLRCAVVVKDSFKAYTHVFLVPDEGHAEVVKLIEVRRPAGCTTPSTPARWPRTGGSTSPSSPTSASATRPTRWPASVWLTRSTGRTSALRG